MDLHELYEIGCSKYRDPDTETRQSNIAVNADTGDKKLPDPVVILNGGITSIKELRTNDLVYIRTEGGRQSIVIVEKIQKDKFLGKSCYPTEQLYWHIRWNEIKGIMILARHTALFFDILDKTTSRFPAAYFSLIEEIEIEFTRLSKELQLSS